MTRDEFKKILMETASSEVQKNMDWPEGLSDYDFIVKAISASIATAMSATIKTLEKAGFIKFED